VQSASSARPSKVSAPDSPVLIELFTSQGCSSCPPADKLAQRLNREENLVVISRPVDYWDRLGWKDTLASPENTALQRTNARRGLSGYNGVYTPQMVVSGVFGEVGSSEAAIRAQIREATRNAARVEMRVEPVEGRGFAIVLAGRREREAELVLMGVSSREDIVIGRGENRGRTIRYTNALIGEKALVRWSGGKRTVSVNKDQLKMAGADRFAAVLREPNGGPVLAARWMD